MKHPLIKKFLSYYKPHKKLLVIDIFCALIQTAIDLAFPVILRLLTAGLFTEGPEAIYGSMLMLALGIICMYAVRYGCKYFISGWGHIMGARIETAMRQDLFNQYERFSFSYFDKHNTGDMMSRLVNDLFEIAEVAHHGPESAIICILEAIGSFCIMFSINCQLACAMAAVTVVLVVYNIWINQRMQRSFTENRERISGVNSQAEDALEGARVVKSFANENLERKKFGYANNAYLTSKENMYHSLGSYQAAVSLLTGALYSIIVILGGFLIAQGKMTAVDLATYALYVGLLTTPIQTLVDFTENFQKAAAGFKRFNQVLETTPDIVSKPGAPMLNVTSGDIVYDDVHFGYVGSEHVLDGFNLHIESGKTYALVGPSGGGKSTTCSLLPRFYDVDSGSVRIDGQDVRDVDLDSLRRSIGIVQQDVYLFDGSIADNIAYGKIDATEIEIIDAAKAANIHDFIESLPDGYNTPVGQRGGHLSGGQKQRIAIARVFLKNPKILVLDEATSALDNESERAVQESLARLSAGRTTLVIAHRLSTIKDADVIVTVQAGKVVELGSHEELLTKGGIYANYFNLQYK